MHVTRQWLCQFTESAGHIFGTEDLSLFLHALIRMQLPKTVVELGTGLGVTALWMALAAKLNHAGHVWAVDDFSWFDQNQSRIEALSSSLAKAGVSPLDPSTAAAYYSDLTNRLGVDAHLTFVKSRIDLADIRHFNAYPFDDQPIDLLFSDFSHGPLAVVSLLGAFLNRMSSSSSMFIHSASTSWPSYLLLENIVTQLNAGKVPKALQDACQKDLTGFVQSQRILLVHLTERKDRNQNSVAWLKIEPVDIFPSPRTRMRAMC